MSDKKNDDNKPEKENLEEFAFEEFGNAEDIVDEKDAESSFSIALGVFIAMSLVLISYSFYTAYEFSTDDSVPLVVCPRDYTLDAPVIMTRLDDNRDYVHERWVRGFIRRFSTKLFPRTKADVKPFYEYIVNHSKYEVADEYAARLEDLEDIESAVDSGQFIQMYAKGGGLELRIRPQDESANDRKTWVIEMDAYVVINDGLSQIRETPVLRFVVESASPTITNPEGLYVVEYENKYTVDYVSGNKLEEPEEEEE